MNISGTLIDKVKDEKYRNAIIDALTGGIGDEFQEYFDMVIRLLMPRRLLLFCYSFIDLQV